MQITVLARYLGNATFFLTNIHNHLHFNYFAIHAFYSNFLIAFLSFISPVEDCSSGSRKLVVFNHFSQRSFFKFQQFKTVPHIPYRCCSLWSRSSWSIVSKAADRSSITKTTSCLLSIALGGH